MTILEMFSLQNKVAIIAPNSLPVPPIRGGGIQNVIAETVPLYKEFKPYVFSNCEYGIDKLPLKETAGNVEHRRICRSPWDEFKIRFTHLSTLNYLPYVLDIIGQIKEVKPDVIHLMNRPWFLPILRKHLGPDIKIILHHFNNYLMEMKRDRAKKYLGLIDAFIGCSDFTVRAEVLERFPEYASKCFVVSNGLDPTKFDPDKIDKSAVNQLRNKYGIKDNDVVVMYVGRLSKDKGAGELLQAAKELINDQCISNLKLLIVGSSFFGGQTKVTPFIKELHVTADAIKDNIVFTGFIDRPNIHNIFALADIVAVPSIVDDASPTVCYEASAMKIPIVASKRGGIPEIVEDGKTGLLVNDPQNIGDLAEKILYFINKPGERKAFGERGRIFMEKNFTWKIVAQKLESVYKKVLTF